MVPALGGHIKPGSRIVHDGEGSHKALVEALGLESEVHTSVETKGLTDGKNPLARANRAHSLIKRFLREHMAFKREELQGWLNLIWFILTPPASRYEKVAKFVAMALPCRKLLRFRETMCKKRKKHR